LEENDREAILEIARTTWDGHDHLPKMFDEWLVNPNCHPIGIAIEGRLVGLGCVRLIEEGKTAWLEGLRVYQDYRGKGISRIITSQLKELAINLGASRTRLTMSIDNPIPRKLAESIGMTCISLQDIRWLRTRRPRKRPDESIVIDNCSVEEFVKYSHEHLLLVPENVITYFWYALDATDYAVSKLREIAGIQFLTARKESNLVGLSVGYPRRGDEASTWSTTIYPTSREPLLSLLHFQMVQCAESGIGTLMLQYPSKFTDYVKDHTLLKRPRHSLTLGLFEGIL
jgi:GNAT superfamily N-acetyltransferase